MLERWAFLLGNSARGVGGVWGGGEFRCPRLLEQGPIYRDTASEIRN